ncbi:hypothetical protein KAW64_12140 [bacterium]|jgi:hypothetical protein|nr:hypothetical protein [bacterium]
MVTRKTVLTALLVVMAAGILGSGCGGGGGVDIIVDGPVVLSRSFEEGDVLKYKFKMGSQSGIKRTAHEQTIYTQTEITTTCTFGEVTEDDVTMRMLFTNATGSITVGDRPEIDKSVAELRGNELEFTLDPTGTVLSWTGIGSSDYLEAGAGQMAILLYDVFPALTDKALDIGVSWTTDYDIPDLSAAVDRDFSGETTYTVTGFKSKNLIDCVVISRHSDFSFEGRAEQAGEVWLMEGDGTVDGDLFLSIEDASLVFSSGEMKMTLTGEGSSVGGAAASNVVEMGIVSSLRIELAE